MAEGAIVGSAIVRHLEEMAGHPEKVDASIRSLVQYATGIATVAHAQT
jgi:tryptophan synthase alpha subunit